MTIEQVAKWCQWDALGFIPGCNESAEEYEERVASIRKAHEEFERNLAEKGELTVFDAIKVKISDRIDEIIVNEAADITQRLYGFKVGHVPGFFLSGEVGLLWGGCLIGDPDLHLSIFFIRKAFREKLRWLNYRRDELLAHELCHSVRQVLFEPMLEEFFAYQTSPSFLRRYLGNCFIREWDALLFLLPVMLLPVAELINVFWLPQLPIWPFWIFAAIYPVFLFFRNLFSRQILIRAKKGLYRGGVENPLPVLFRCTKAELYKLETIRNRNDLQEFIYAKAAHEPRWAIIKQRFFNQGGE